MSSPWKKQPEEVVDSVLKRAEVSKIARHLQSRLALAQFKAKHGWEDLTLDTIEPKVEEELRRRKTFEQDGHSDSSSSVSDLPYPTKALMSSPLKAPIFSDAINSSSGSSGHRKRTYMASFDAAATSTVASSPSKRFRASPTTHKSFSAAASWKETHQLAQSSPIKPRRQQHFTTSAGPNVSFFQTHRMMDDLASPNFAAPSDDDDDLLPAHSFNVNASARHASPPRTPPMQSRSLNRRGKENKAGGKSGEEGADLLLYLAASPSPAVKSTRAQLEIPTTPPQQKSANRGLDLPSSMMTTPGGGNLFPSTPGQGFDFSEFVNISPSPAQKPWKTPVSLSTRTPRSLARKRLTFDEPMA